MKKLKSYLNKNQIEAYRLYNKDIPEYPYLIDVYGKQAVIYEQGKKLNDEEQAIRENHQRDIEIAIEDNGKGFDVEQAYHGNGMTSLRRRGEELGGSVNIQSRINVGTYVQLNFRI